MKFPILISATLFSLQTFSATKNDITDQIRSLRFDLQNSQATSLQLDQVVNLIQEAQDILTGYSGPVDKFLI